MGAHDDPGPDNVENDPLLGRVIDGRFTIQSVLGRGGMGVVYRAHQASLERSVALKLMTGVPPERAAEFQRRFFLEAATAARLKHPNTITVFDYGSSSIDDESVFYITMELLEGVTLSKLVAKGRALPPLRAIHIGLQISRSLREAHKAGVVHRDLKPGNVMLVRQDEADDVEGDFVKVLDFGLAKSRAHDAARPLDGLTKAGTFMGSPRYVAPEQVEGKIVDHRADIYSFGCLMFRMLSGRVPFDGQQAVEIMLKHIHDPAPALDVPGLPQTLVRLIADCLAKDPAVRPASMDVVAQRLKLARAELGGQGSGILVLSDDPAADRGDRSDLPMPEELPPSSLPPSSLPPSSLPPSSLPPTSLPPEVATQTSLPPQPTPGTLEPSPAEILEGAPAAEPADERSSSHSRSRSSSRSSSQLKLDPRESTDWGVLKPMSAEDSTRPTRILGQIALNKPPRRPWAAIASGVVIGLAICGYLVAWRLGSLDPFLAELRGRKPTPPHETTPRVEGPAVGPFAKQARVRITTNPAGADVLEVVDGLPRLLGITPLTLDWDVAARPAKRELMLRKDGFVPSKAVLAPPAPAEREPVWVDVDASLRPLK